MGGKEWGPIERDGWVQAHDAIRLDLADALEVLDRLLGAPQLEGWELDSLRIFWRRAHENLDTHHHLEEELFFPLVRTRFELPERYTTDHRRLDELLAEATAAVDKAAAQSDLAEVRGRVRALAEHVRPHLLEEERDSLPLVRAHFSADEWHRKTMPTLRKLPWLEVPHFLRLHGRDMAKKRAVAVGELGMPGFIFDKKVKQDIERYWYEYGWHIEALKEPARRAKLEEERAAYEAQRRGCCGCFGR